MPSKQPYEREMRKRYPERIFNNAQDAENYKTIANEKGIKYTVKDDGQGNFYVGEGKSHPYWRPVARKPEQIRYYDEEGREI